MMCANYTKCKGNGEGEVGWGLQRTKRQHRIHCYYFHDYESCTLGTVKSTNYILVQTERQTDRQIYIDLITL